MKTVKRRDFEQAHIDKEKRRVRRDNGNVLLTHIHITLWPESDAELCRFLIA
jgi:hypothetical protein